MPPIYPQFILDSGEEIDFKWQGKFIRRFNYKSRREPHPEKPNVARIIYNFYTEVNPNKPYIIIRVSEDDRQKLYPVNKQALQFVSDLHRIHSWISTDHICAGYGWVRHGRDKITWDGIPRVIISDYIKCNMTGLNRRGECYSHNKCKIHIYHSKSNICYDVWDEESVDFSRIKCEKVSLSDYKKMSYPEKWKNNWELVFDREQYDLPRNLLAVSKVTFPDLQTMLRVLSKFVAHGKQEWLMNRVWKENLRDICGKLNGNIPPE